MYEYKELEIINISKLGSTVKASNIEAYGTLDLFLQVP
jgi:hypothetical protein